MSRVHRRLRASDVPRSLRNTLDFEKQEMRISPSGQYGSLQIRKKCPTCNRGKWSSASDIRSAIKKQTYTGLCTSCTGRKNGSRNNKTGPETAAWRGGRYKNNYGYLLRHRNSFTDEQKKIINPMLQGSGQYVLEHRAVLALEMGRPLLVSETVHHIDQIKDNNHPTNLELRHGVHGPGNTLPHCLTCTCRKEN